jgi:hypothetical protein
MMSPCGLLCDHIIVSWDKVNNNRWLWMDFRGSVNVNLYFSLVSSPIHKPEGVYNSQAMNAWVRLVRDLLTLVKINIGVVLYLLCVLLSKCWDPVVTYQASSPGLFSANLGPFIVLIAWWVKRAKHCVESVTVHEFLPPEHGSQEFEFSKRIMAQRSSWIVHWVPVVR